MKTLKLMCAAIAAVCCSLVAKAADPVTYLDWDPVKRQMTNVTCSSYVVVTNGIEVFEAGTTYVVNDWVTAPFSVFVNGTESEPTILVLCDGGWLTVSRGVEVTDGHKLVICEQADGDEEATRQLTSTGCDDYAGIGGGWNGACGTIVINGGIVNATGGYQSAGIGGGFIGGNKDGGNVTINGGTVNARGHTNAAGIGGANGGAGGTVTINGGMVSGYGGASAAGIGGGYHGAGGTVAINGGMVTGEGGEESGAAGIGAGAYESPMDPGTVTFGPGMDYWILAGTSWLDQVEVSKAEFIADHSAPSVFISSWPGQDGPLIIQTGRYSGRIDLVDVLGIEIPDVDYAIGDKVTVKVEGLPKGLKLVTTQLKETTGKKAVTNVVYTIEGVPTETVDFDTQAMYARVSVTYKDKTMTADKTGKVELLQPIELSIVTPEPSVLTAGVLNEVYEPVDIAELWPEVKDAKVNPTEWSFKGWPAGVKYNATAKDVNWSYKSSDGKSYGAIAVPYTVYGQPTKAGVFPITATWKHKLADNKTTVSETFSAVLTVWGDVEDEDEFRYTDQAYVATATKTLDATWKSFSGLPTGIKYTTKLIAADTKKGTPEYPAYSLYGTPTKAGVFAVTATKVDPDDAKKTVKETFLWKVDPATAPTFALDTGTAPIVDLKAQIVQGANQSFAITASEGAKVTVTGLPTGLKLVQDKTTGLYTVEGVASKPGEYFVTFKTVLNGVTTVTTTAFTVQANPFTATYCGYTEARPAAGAAYRFAVVEVTVAAAGTVKLTYTEGKTKYTASVKSFDWNDATGNGTAEGLILKVSSADKTLGYGDRGATVTFEDCGVYLKARLNIADADGSTLLKGSGSLFATVKTTEVPLPASQTFVFRMVDGTDTNALATVSVAYDANKATAAFSGKLYDGTAVKATVPVTRWGDDGTSNDYAFAPFLVIAKDGTVYVFNYFSSDYDGGYIDWVSEDGEEVEESWSTPADYADADAKFAELVPETGAFTFGWGSDAGIVGTPTESFEFEVTTDAKGNPAGVAIYDAYPQPGEKPLATVTAKVGKTTGAISVSFTSKKGDKAKYVVELVWRGEQIFAGHVTRTWKDGKVSNTAYGTAEVK